jgi:hypothetical protein
LDNVFPEQRLTTCLDVELLIPLVRCLRDDRCTDGGFHVWGWTGMVWALDNAFIEQKLTTFYNDEQLQENID